MKKRLKVGNNNGQLRIANATSDGARKAAWANIMQIKHDPILLFTILIYVAVKSHKALNMECPHL